MAWTRERIAAAVQAWAAEHGQPPTYNEWKRGDPKGKRPTGARCQQVFGSWAGAIAAAGFVPKPRYNSQPDGGRCRKGHDLSVDGYVSPSGRRRCRVCLAERQRQQRARRAARRAYLRRVHERRLAEGLCTRCGKQPAERDRTCCSGCLAYLRDADRRRRQAG